MEIEQPNAKSALRDMIEQSRGPTAARLELSAQPDPFIAFAGSVAADVGQVRSDLAVAVENIRHLPTKLWLSTAMLGTAAGFGVIAALLIRYVPPA